MLQPMRNSMDLRLYLQNHYFIQSDEIFYDKKYYTLILARSGKDHLDEMQAYFGKTNLVSPSDDFKRFLADEQTKYSAIVASCDGAEAAYKLRMTEAAQKSIENI